MTPENFVKAQIATFAYNEAAHFGGVDGMLAVACILRNRVKKGWFGGDWLEVINNAAEVASLTPLPPRPISLASQDFRRLLQEVDDIFLGMFKDEMTEGGLYYMDAMHAEHGQSIRPWFAEKILRDFANHPRKAQVAMLHIFG